MGQIGQGSGSSYPAVLDTATSYLNGTPTLPLDQYTARAEFANDVQAAVLALETSIGNPANYLYLPGRASGQIAYGGTGAGDSLSLRSTAHATKGFINIGTAGTCVYDDVNNRLGVGVAVPLHQVHIYEGNVSGDMLYIEHVLTSALTTCSCITAYASAYNNCSYDVVSAFYPQAIAQSNSSTITYVSGLEIIPVYLASGGNTLSVTAAYHLWVVAPSVTNTASTINVTTMMGIRVEALGSANFTSVSTSYGIYIAPDAVSTTSNKYGLYVGAHAGASGVNYGIYGAGGNFVFNGNTSIGIGTASAYPLTVSGMSYLAGHIGVNTTPSATSGLYDNPTFTDTEGASTAAFLGGFYTSTTALVNNYCFYTSPVVITQNDHKINSFMAIYLKPYLYPIMSTQATVCHDLFAAVAVRLAVYNTAAKGTVTSGVVFDIQTLNQEGSPGPCAVTITSNFGCRVANMGTASGFAGVTIGSSCGFSIAEQTGATNNVGLLIGTNSIPAGSFSFYNASANPGLIGNAYYSIGAAPSATAALYIGKTWAADTDNAKGAYIISVATATAGAITTHSGISVHPISVCNGQKVTTSFALDFINYLVPKMALSTTVAATSAYGMRGGIHIYPGATVGTISNVFSLYADAIKNEADGSQTIIVTQANGLIISNIGTPIGTAGITVQSACGINILDCTGASTGNANIVIGNGGTVPAGNWNIYSASTTPSYFAGGRYFSIVAGTDGLLLTAAMHHVVANSTSAVGLTLPPATGSGRKYFIKNVNTGNVTVTADTSGTPDLIDGYPNQILLQYDCMELIDWASDKWAII